jgi:hypothetical protein
MKWDLACSRVADRPFQDKAVLNDVGRPPAALAWAGLGSGPKMLGSGCACIKSFS